MTIHVEKGAAGYRAKLMDLESMLYETKWHPRPGCAVREAMIHMQILLGQPQKTVVLKVVEWV